MNVPANGAMYFEQSVIVSDGTNKTDSCSATVGPRASVVNGRVTIASKGNVYIGGNNLVRRLGRRRARPDRRQRGDHHQVHALRAQLAGRLAGAVRPVAHLPGSADGAHSSMTYTGSQTTADGGYASMFNTRIYQYDDTLQRLRPPFYPILEGSWNTYYWREVLPPS